LLFQSSWTAVANDVKHSGPDSGILIFSHFEDSAPELINVHLNLAWTKLFAGFQPDISIVMMSVLKYFINVFGVSTDVDELLLALSVLLGGDFLFVLLTLGHVYF
jgi:hypothetical protein